MKKEFNIAIVGLGQIGIFLYNELKRNQKTIRLLTGKKIKIVGLSARNKNKKRVAPKIKYIRILNFFSLKDIKRHTKLNPKIV